MLLLLLMYMYMFVCGCLLNRRRAPPDGLHLSGARAHTRTPDIEGTCVFTPDLEGTCVFGDRVTPQAFEFLQFVAVPKSMQ